MELWKQIEGFEDYSVSSYGRVISSKYNKRSILVGGVKKNGYPFVLLSKNNKRFLRTVHRLVAIAFLPNPENKKEVNHIDGNKRNANVSNLEWATRLENGSHASACGLMMRGEAHLDSKLTERDVRDIRESALRNGELSKKYCVSTTTIHKIINRLTWRHVA